LDGVYDSIRTGQGSRALGHGTTVDADETSPFDRLIFPAPNNDADLSPWDFSDTGNASKFDFNVTNVILCLINTNDPKRFAVGAQRRLQERWDELITRAEEKARTDLRMDPAWSQHHKPSNHSTWNHQKDQKHDVFEFYAAWVPYTDGHYAGARQQVMRLLGARKTLRNFSQWHGVHALQKSSLDAARETVLKNSGQRSPNLRVKNDEHLDIVGVVKRVEFGHNSIRYPSVSRYAADPWIRGVSRHVEGRQFISELCTICSQLDKLDALRMRRSFNGRPIENDIQKFPWLEHFPFEGTPLYVDRHKELIQECSRHYGESNAAWEQRKTNIETSLQNIARQMQAQQSRFGIPSPYFAILAADGDRMGRTISALAKRNDPKVHREFSRAQSLFDETVRKRINGQEHDSTDPNDRLHGATVFAGADDILAFVPLDQCIRSARLLYDLFDDALRQRLSAEIIQELKDADAWPTLSVGMAIGHFMEPLEDLLSYARAAERRAKNPIPEEREREQKERNGLAIAIHARSGAPFIVRDNWLRYQQGLTEENAQEASLSRFDDRLHTWAELHVQQLLPSKAAYDLRRLSLDYEHWPSGHALTQAIQQDALRLLKRKRPEAGEPGQVSRAQLHLGKLIQLLHSAADLRALADELLVGQWVASAMVQAAGHYSDEEVAAEELS